MSKLITIKAVRKDKYDFQIDNITILVHLSLEEVNSKIEEIAVPGDIIQWMDGPALYSEYIYEKENDA